MTHTPNNPAAEQNAAYMRALGHVLTDQVIDDIIEECQVFLSSKVSPLLCRALCCIHSLRQENKRINSIRESTSWLTRDKVRSVAAGVVIECFARLLEPSPAEKAAANGQGASHANRNSEVFRPTKDDTARNPSGV